MQLPQLYRRGVVRPLDEESANELATLAVTKPIRVEWLPVLSDDHFAEIWDTGVLQRINQACGVLISDYEEVVLVADDVPMAQQAISNIEFDNDNAACFVGTLRSLLADAAVDHRCVYFIL